MYKPANYNAHTGRRRVFDCTPNHSPLPKSPELKIISRTACSVLLLRVLMNHISAAATCSAGSLHF